MPFGVENLRKNFPSKSPNKKTMKRLFPRIPKHENPIQLEKLCLNMIVKNFQVKTKFYPKKITECEWLAIRRKSKVNFEKKRLSNRKRKKKANQKKQKKPLSLYRFPVHVQNSFLPDRDEKLFRWSIPVPIPNIFIMPKNSIRKKF